MSATWAGGYRCHVRQMVGTFLAGLMSEEFTYDVFLNHAPADEGLAREIEHRLSSNGLRVWFRDWSIRPRGTAEEWLDYELDSSRVQVLFVSQQALGPDWALLEAATLRFRDPANAARRFIPLRLDQTALKGWLAQLQYIEWTPEGDEDLYRKLLVACRPPPEPPVVEADTASDQLASNSVHLETDSIIKQYAFAFTPDARLALTPSGQSLVRLWDLDAQQAVRDFPGHSGTVLSLAWTSDAQFALSGSQDRTIRMWDVATGECVHILRGHTADVLDVSWSTDRRLILSASQDQTIRLWDSTDGRCVSVLEGHTDAVTCVAWSADQQFVISGSKDKTIRSRPGTAGK